MKILVAPLNWGLGHATRCIPIISDLISQGHEVVIGADGQAAEYLKDRFPYLQHIALPELNLCYSSGSSQVWTIVRQLPHFFRWINRDDKARKEQPKLSTFDVVISDNRFGLRGANYSIYITHQLHIMLPRGWKWLEPLLERWHRHIIERYNECWVPDYEDITQSLAGKLSHPDRLPKNVRYIGPLSRMAQYKSRQVECDGSIVAVISGLEPQRTIFEEAVKQQYGDKVHIINGKPPYPSDEELADMLLRAKTIISRSGYSSIMDYHALGVLNKAQLTPTPGQPEQEYLMEQRARNKEQGPNTL